MENKVSTVHYISKLRTNVCSTRIMGLNISFKHTLIQLAPIMSNYKRNKWTKTIIRTQAEKKTSTLFCSTVWFLHVPHSLRVRVRQSCGIIFFLFFFLCLAMLLPHLQIRLGTAFSFISFLFSPSIGMKQSGTFICLLFFFRWQRHRLWYWSCC